MNAVSNLEDFVQSAIAEERFTEGERDVDVRRRHVCGDCAVRIVAEGGERVRGGIIEMGTSCALHRAFFDGDGPHATSTILVPEGYEPKRALVELGGGKAANDPLWLDAPREVGPVTKLAHELVVAWSREDKAADDLLIVHAVDVAQKIIAATKGR